MTEDDEDHSANISISQCSLRAVRSTIALFSSSRRAGNTGQLMDRIALELNPLRRQFSARASLDINVPHDIYRLSD